MLTCRLQQRSERDERDPTSGLVQLRNQSRQRLIIEHETHPFEHLDLLVHDLAGNRLPARHYGTCVFTRFGSRYELILEPEEVYQFNVSLLHNVEPRITAPGIFDVQAEYEYADRIIRSNIVRVVLKKEHLQDY